MEYCRRCVYPKNAKPTITFDEQGICSGCRYEESRRKIDWVEREGWLAEILAEARSDYKDKPWDCIIPVSGGKDSTWQVKTLIEKYHMRPLLVTFNHAWNSHLGVANLRNLVDRSGCSLIRYSLSPEQMRRLSRWSIKKMGDPTWAYHSGIMSFPIQIAVKYDVPLMLWGEEGFSELVGLLSLDYMQEWTKWKRTEHSMRGWDVDRVLADETAREEGITKGDLAAFQYPTEDEIEKVNLRGLYLSNFFEWDALKQAKEVHDEWGFRFHPGPRELTMNLYAKTDDHANAFHIWPRFLKYGYGRATDDVSTEIRHGRMTREEGIELVRHYDRREPTQVNAYLNRLGMSMGEFLSYIDPMRDPAIWKKKNGEWVLSDGVENHKENPDRLPVDKTDFHYPYYWMGEAFGNEYSEEFLSL